MRIKDIIVSLLMFLAATAAQAQITIGGSVYGGGNEGDVTGNTTVTVHAGDIENVFGGARMADVGGRAFVNIDGAHASDNILITSVYGGNDIAGTIGTSENLPLKTDSSDGLTEVGTDAGKNAIDNTWNAFIRTSPTPSAATSLVIGSMYGGGNGDYDYNDDSKPYYNKSVPNLDKTYLEIKGGCIAHLYGGGNNATINGNTTICIDNNSPVLDHTNVWPANAGSPEGQAQLLALAQRMEMSTFQSNLTSYAFNFARVFGGNNKAPMAIRPTWNLKNGTIRDLYSGGNAGAMTYEQGIMLIISSDGMTVENVYGGCRMADVNPAKNEMPRLDGTFNGIDYHFPAGYAARLLIAGGNINNVYGGNDISGTVYGGNAVGIHSQVNGDIYGGGNGSYAYTDNKDLKGDPTYGDFYYDVNKILGKADNYSFSGMESAQALNEFRPNAERVSLRLLGSENKPTIIHGSVYCGGNSATLKNKTAGSTASAELKIGSYVIADNVFLGSNGENLIEPDLLKLYKGEVSGKDFSQMDLGSETKVNGKTQFDEYMDAVSISVRPQVVFDTAVDGQAYIPYSTQIGSFYCGGNVGSVKTEGVVDIDFAHEVIIFDKLVGGCNNANVDAQSDNGSKLNVAYEGGVLGDKDANGNKLILSLSGLKVQPKRWKKNNDGSLYENPTTHLPELEFNTISAKTGEEVASVTSGSGHSDDADLDRRFKGGNIYGGCYNSGHIDGNVVINLNSSVVDRKGNYAIFDKIEEVEGEANLYNNNQNFNILERRSGVILDQQGMDVLGKALNVFGGGYGEESEIWGSTTINLNAGYTFQIFGGGEKGAIGKGVRNTTTGKLEYTYDEKYSCTINVKGDYAGTYRGDTDNSDGVVDNEGMAEAEFIYGGSFEAPIAGNTQINLGNGRVFNTFAGSCNADILGHTETYIGRQPKDDGTFKEGFPWVRDHLYGANDLGGEIKKEASFLNNISSDIRSMVYDPDNEEVPDVVQASAYIEYIQGRVDYIYGGCYGVYDYTDPYFKDYTYTRTKHTNETTGEVTYTYTNDGSNSTNVGKAKTGFTKPRMSHAFINFKPNTNTRNAVTRVFGAGQGIKDEKEMNDMQLSSYVLIDAPDVENFVNMEVFGAGSFGGLGMRLPKAEAAADLDNVSAVIDLMRGKIANVYGASWNEGMTRRTVVNVPYVSDDVRSTINVNNIFGGAYGADPLIPCDVYEAKVNYHSEAATVRGTIYGGNNLADRTLYGQVNVTVPVWQDRATGTLAIVYGAGYGPDSWSQYTEVNLTDRAQLRYVYGGGQNGKVLNLETVTKWAADEEARGEYLDLTIGSDYEDYGLNIPANDPDAYLVKTNGLGTKTNANVYIGKGALVGYITEKEGAKYIDGGYAFGGGYGADAIVSGTTYVGLHGGVVAKDIYGGGYGGSVLDERGAKTFIAQTNSYIEGGTLRKVFGGGYEGHIGKHTGEEVEGKSVAVAGPVADDIPGETNVVVGIRKDQVFPEDYVYDNADHGDSLNYYKGVPAIQWNAYGAGEGGSVFGTSHVTINNGYIGYDYDGIKTGADDKQYEAYIPKLDNETIAGTGGANQLKDYGCVFGAGYDDKSSSDFTDIKIYGGVIRGSLYGGGEIATVGRGRAAKQTGLDRQVTDIYLPGGTHIEMYNGHVLRQVFGGGKGYNLEGYGGTHELYTDGYVFGKTEVYIHGGQVGTTEGLAEGYGNVFGGGDVGFVYGTGYFDQYTKAEKTNQPKGSTGSPDHWYYYGSYQCKENYGPYHVGDVISDVAYGKMSSTERAHWNAGKYLTEDCKVVVSPYLQVRPGQSVSYGDKTYNAYDYVPTEYLNTLKKKEGDTENWKKMFCGDGTSDSDPADAAERGVVILNAVFAGGNVSSNSDQTYSNAKTVFGNTTATLYDVYHRDFITVGTEHIGGLYGGGNLSLVDGYRELNITNYGTDYYGLDAQITLAQYRKLTNRERSYFKLEYLCKVTHTYNGKSYTANESRISEDEYNAITDSDEKARWEQYGFCSIYAGRLLNTIQRADLCGVFGSRLVLQGAKDRVATEEDATNASTATVYTINRVGELSLNKQKSIVSSDTGDDAEHGNYFGIYSVVNYLGHLTSDVKFTDTYQKWNKETKKAETVKDDQNNNYTYYSWKTSRLKNRDRNNGTCHNQVALASGVFLEVTTEYSTPSNKVYGDITGIVELDLINVKKDIEGGGYVYARNEHGHRTEHDYTNIILSSYNKENVAAGREAEARTYKRYTYDKYGTESAQILDHETSGNFIHKTKRIVDDCYPHNGVYNDGYAESPAHYWFIKGEVYIYDRDLTAYAGSAQAYSKNVSLPLTISAASDGKLKLLNVQPNLYAYQDANRQKIGAEGVKVNNESETYYLNDVITWWDWNQLPHNEQAYFVQETFVNVENCTINGTLYEAGTYVMDSMPTTASFTTVLNQKGEDAKTEEGIKNLFRSSNNIGHDTGYVVTFDMDSPKEWDDWYSLIAKPTEGMEKITKEIYNNGSTDKTKYIEGPTYALKSTASAGLYGQRTYKVGEILTKEIYDDYTTTVGSQSFSGQAMVERAYVAKESYGNIQAGNPISSTDYGKLSDDVKSKYEKAMVCTNTIQLGDNEFILMGDLVAVNETDENETELKAIATRYMNYNNGKQNADQITDAEALDYVKACLTDAYYCTKEGLYGGQYFAKGKNYSAIKSWCSLSDSDREKFDFNYDAFDVLSDQEYHGNPALYQSPYSDTKSVEYTATYTGNGTLYYYNEGETVPEDGVTGAHTIAHGESLTREAFENIMNEQRNYTPINVPAGSDNYTAYIATETFVDGGVPVAEGEDVTAKYSSLSTAGKEKVTSLTIAKASTAQTVYYNYKNQTGPINAETFRGLKNYQKDFTVQGKEPTGIITLYVSGQSQPKDVTSEKIITVVYQYTYYESDEDSEGTTLMNELHVLNIHLKLESGVPEIGQLSAPPTVLPGNTVGMKAPSVNPGLYEPLGNGWEMYSSESDAEMKRNGVPFTNNGTQLYWYQDQKVWVAYYTKTVLGKTYSNPVQISVANYHDLDAVMKDKDHHLYVDHPGVARNSKIYIDNRTCESDPEKSELDLLKDFFDLSLQTPTAEQTTYSIDGTVHNRLNSHVRAGRNLDFILNSDVSPKKYTTWTPIGYDGVADDPSTKDIDEGATGQCFDGTLHGDGYTISGLSNSLFDYLCGEVYNLGVTGTFTSAGIANTGSGYVENCWVMSTADAVNNQVNAVFGNPSDTKGVQLVNSYYDGEKNAYSETSHARGNAHKMTTRDFCNGTVAYNLNNFYLNMRYYNGIGQSQTTNSYYYLPVNKADNTLPENLSVCYYPATPDAKYGDVGYVEKRYSNEDFIYAGGRVPDGIDIHQRSVAVEGGNSRIQYAPIWPDDYLFFGQTLNYGYGTQAHDNQPVHLTKVDGRVPQSESSNRIYRAPAYFQSSVLDVAHFNSQAYLAAYFKSESISNPNTKPAYPNMTAIDFAGHQEGTATSSYKQGYNGKLFYQPLLDDDGLLSVSNNGETKNLLVYAPSNTANLKTYTVLNNYFVPKEPAFAFNITSLFTSDNTLANYNRVAATETGEIVGHLVQSDLKTNTDHLLVDLQEFDCPIAYTMGSSYRMWYQRKPDNFVTLVSGDTKGWDVVSLPFEVKMVTTHQKGEISHFYSTSTTGHEYWLREFAGNVKQKMVNNVAVPNVFTADFNSMAASTAENSYTYDYYNTFLWDYYYSKNPNNNTYGDDANGDDYKEYYKGKGNDQKVNSYQNYPLQQPGKAYLIGFPGASYDEFDLSGQWTAQNTALPAPAKLDKQTITFVSATGVGIGVSDNEKEGTAINANKFQPNYLSKKLGTNDYLLNGDGNSFDKAGSSSTVPFRPYLYVVNADASGTRGGERKDSINSVVFGGDVPQMKVPKEINQLGGDDDLIVTAGKKKICVESQLRYTTDVRIVTPAGVTLATYSIQSSEYVETQVYSAGVYIVYADNGKYVKKVIVK